MTASVWWLHIKQRNQHRKEICFLFLWQEQCHSKIPSEWLCVCVSITLLFWQKVQSALSANILPFQIMNSNTKVRCKRCSRLIKKTPVKRKPIIVVLFVTFEETLHLVWVLSWPFSKSKQTSGVVLAGFQYWYPHTFIMQPTGPLQRTADKATSKIWSFLF